MSAEERIVAALVKHGERTNRQLMAVGVKLRDIWRAADAGVIDFRPAPDAAIRWKLTS